MEDRYKAYLGTCDIGILGNSWLSPTASCQWIYENAGYERHSEWKISKMKAIKLAVISQWRKISQQKLQRLKRKPNSSTSANRIVVLSLSISRSETTAQFLHDSRNIFAPNAPNLLLFHFTVKYLSLSLSLSASQFSVFFPLYFWHLRGGGTCYTFGYRSLDIYVHLCHTHMIRGYTRRERES